jgi:hypothetical protein
VKFEINKMIEKDPQSEWYVAGTEETGEFVCPLKSDLGLVSFRCTVDHRGSIVRVRVEPANDAAAERLAEAFPTADGWKQPSTWQYRFSKVFTDTDEAIATVERAIEALGVRGKRRQTGYVRFWRMAIRQHLPALATVA